MARRSQGNRANYDALGPDGTGPEERSAGLGGKVSRTAATVFAGVCVCEQSRCGKWTRDSEAILGDVRRRKRREYYVNKNRRGGCSGGMQNSATCRSR